MRLKKTLDQNKLLIFMQEKLAEMKSKFMTQVTIRVKPRSEPGATDNHTADDDDASSGMLPEPFNVLNDSTEMGLAKQIVITDAGS